MPKHEQSISLGSLDAITAIAITYETMKQLGWDPIMAGENTLLGSTPKSWNKKNQHVLCIAEPGTLTVRSEMIFGEMLDLGGRNKKNTNAFVAGFEKARASVTASEIESAANAILGLQKTTRETAAQQQREQQELNSALNLEGSNLYVTYAIIAINVLVFILMAMDGAGIFTANGLVHLKWGSNFSPLTLSGDWWRLLSCVFIHFGIIHLAMNMYCLYTVGIYLEPMLGKLKYTTAYLCTGVMASLVSLWWHTEPANSAGASGAVFGMYGVFLALLTSNLIPKAARQELLKSIGVFVAYNLIYGMKSGVDNAAHVGGLVSGFLFGYLLVFGINREKKDGVVLKWIVPALVLITVGSAYGYIQQHPASAEARNEIQLELKNAGFKDNAIFNDKLSEFDLMHRSINESLDDSTLTDEQLLPKIQEADNQWKKLSAMFRSTSSYDISPTSHKKAEKLIEYIELRQQELVILQSMINNKEEDLLPKFNETRLKANAVFKEAVKL
jgi:rhomboid protease GluP